MENAIKKAQLSGYIVNCDDKGRFNMYETVCDPFFWQALSQSCGWKTTGKHQFTGNNLRCNRCGAPTDWDDDCIENEIDSWKINALRFHEINLTEGWNKAIEYLESIIK